MVSVAWQITEMCNTSSLFILVLSCACFVLVQELRQTIIIGFFPGTGR